MKKRILLTFRCFFVTNCMLLVLFQEQIMRNDIGQLFGIMRYHNHGLVSTTAEGFYDFPDATAVVRIQPMQRFVKNQQFGATVHPR